MKGTRKEYVEYLNSFSPDKGSELWIIGGKNRYNGRDNWGLMLKRHDPIAFDIGYKEWLSEIKRQDNE